MGRHMEQEQSDSTLEIVGVGDWKSLELMQPFNCHQMDQGEHEGQVHIVVAEVAGMLWLTSNCSCLVQLLLVEPISCSVEVQQQEQGLGESVSVDDSRILMSSAWIKWKLQPIATLNLTPLCTQTQLLQ